jgi:hypothetical protein
VHGADDTLAACFSVVSPDREKLVAYWDRLPKPSKVHPTPEHLVGLCYANELLSNVEVMRVSSEVVESAQNAKVTIVVGNAKSEAGKKGSATTFELQKVNGDWRIIVPSDIVEGLPSYFSVNGFNAIRQSQGK